MKRPQYNGYIVGLDHAGREALYFCFSQWGAPLFLLQVNPETGETRQINVHDYSGHGCCFAKSLARGPDEKIYIGTAPGGLILRYDPKRPEDGLRVLGRPSPTETYIYSMVVGKDGKLYAGTYGGAKLVSCDPETGRMEDLGPMDETQMYTQTVAAGEDGLIYVGVGTARANIVVYDPEKRWHKSILPSKWRLEGRSARVSKGRDGKVYAMVPLRSRARGRSVEAQFFLLEEGRAKPIDPEVYPGPPVQVLKDGGYVSEADAVSYTIRYPDGREIRRKFHYKAAGSMVFVVGLGPGGRIYGSSALPLELFVYDPKTGELRDLGNPTSVNGEIYSLLELHGKLYVCAYPGAWLSVYDPKRPFKYGMTEDSNPRGIGYVGDGHLRPRSMIVGPEEKIFIGSMPPYGQYGGAMAVYDPKEGKVVENYRHLIRNQSIVSLAYEPQSSLIFGGSSIGGGGGTRPIEKEARFFAWDPREKRKVLEIVPVPGDVAIVSMEAAKGKVFATSILSNTLFVFDPSSWRIVHNERIPYGRPHEISLAKHKDGYLYGLAGNTIFKVNPETYEISKVADYPGRITCGFAVSDTGIYFGSEVRLIRYRWG